VANHNAAAPTTVTSRPPVTTAGPALASSGRATNETTIIPIISGDSAKAALDCACAPTWGPTAWV